MHAIEAPIEVGQNGPDVANLQDGLQLLLERQIIRALDPPDSPTAEELADLAAKLREEQTESFYGDATQRLVQIVQLQQGLGDNLMGAVEKTTAIVLNRLLTKLGAFDGGGGDTPFSVQGQVTLPGGGAAVGYIVRAVDRDLRSLQPLGTDALTDTNGHYEIRYSSAQFAAADHGGADLVVRVFAADRGGKDRLLVESATMFNAAEAAEINLQIPDTSVQRSEFKLHVDAIVPLLAGQDDDGTAVPIAALKDPDISFLAADTGIERQHIAWLATAFRYSARTAAPDPERHVAQAEGSVAAALFYGWFREGLPDDWEQLIEQSIGVLRTAALAAIEHDIIPAGLAAALESSLDSMPNPQRDALRAAVTATGLGDDTAGTILRRAGAVAEVTNGLVAKLVDEGQLASADAHRAGLGLAAHALVDGDEAAMAAIVGATLSGRGDRGLRRARDLAALDVADIERAFADAGVEPPAGQTPAGYAARIAGQIAAIFPTDAMLHRVTTVTDEVVGAVRRVIAGGNKGAPDRPGSPAANEPSLQAFINLHPGLGLGSVIGAATDVGSAVATIRERVGWVDSVRELNPDLDLLAVDYLPDSESLGQVSFADLPDEARSMVIADLKAYQRIQAVGAGALDGIALLQAGLGSASALALREPAEIAEQTGIPITLARSYAQQAEDKADQTALTWFALYALERDAQVIKQSSFLQPPEYLKKLTGYNELFGSADFCDCENCRSVLGPAAYFVDLMHWVERHILTGSFNAVGGEANDLHPRSRRPDLWTLELTCDNTNLVVPALDLVIAMLEQFIVKQKRLASADALYDQLATVDYSIRLPFSLPVEQLSIFLSHLGITRAQIAEAFLLGSGDADSRARVRLGMVSKEFDIITNSRLGDPPSPAAIRAAEAFFSLWLGGVNLTFSVIPGETETRPLDPISILSFTKAAGLELGVVSEVLASSFVNGTAPGAPAPIQLEAGIGTPGGVQNDTERVLNLTSGRLDRFERLVRLWRHVPWTLAELDHVLVRLQHAAQSAPNQFDGPMVDRLAQLLDLQDKLHLPVDELCALWDALPVSALRGEAALFDRAFNLPSFVRQGGRWPAEDHFFDGTAGERARLVAAMQISDADLTLLLTGLSGCLTAGGQASKTFALGERNLSLLYRHARLAQVLKLSMDDLLQTVALTESITSKQAPTERCILTLDDLQAVVEVHAWRIASGFSIPEIHFITGTVSTLDGYDPPDDIATRLAAEIMAEKSLEITQDLFTQIGLTQAQSAEIIKGNSRPAGGISALLEPVPGAGAFRVARAIGLGDVATGLVFDPDPAPDMIAGFARDLYAIVQRAGDSGFEASGLEVLGLSEAGAAQLVQANVSSGAADGRPFEAVPGSPTHYRLRAAVDQGTAVAAFGAGQDDILAVKSAVRHRAVDLVTRHHAVSVLAAKASAAVKVSPEKTLALLNLVMPTTPAQRSALVDAVQGGPLQPFSAVLDALMRTAVLFRNGAYDAPALAFIGAHPTPWAMSDPRTAETVRRVGLYAKLAASPDRAYQPEAAAPDADALRSVLAMPASIATAAGDQARLTPIARALNSDVAAVGGALSRIALAAGNAVAPRLDELSHLAGALALTGRLGVPAEILRLAVSDSTSELTRAADGVFAAVRAKYPDEATFTEKLEPFIDKLRSRNRDGLVEYLLSAPDDVWRRRFATTSDLYHYFLTDVMVEGCARTSKVVAAISTIQLYVQRVLMNLEQSDEIPPQVTARLEDPDKLQPEWAWRKNYQVWVANRKVFLYPENYIEPGLRDDKTPLFKELEDVLLQQPITEQNVLDVYAKYLHGFDEVARLRVAGAYHDRSDASMDVLHLFGVTASEPPVYYYRTISSLEPPAAMPARPTRPVFSPWTKLDLQIPARRISPIVLHGRLYVFWVETTTRQKTDFKDGASTFTGYRHSVRSKFSYLRLDGRWTPPETLKIADSTGDVLDTRLIEDYLVQDPFLFDAFDKNGRPIRTINAKDDPDPLREKAQFGHDYEGGSVLPVQWAQWDAFSRKHTVPIETYVPGGWKWERIYPSVVGSGDGARIALEFAPRTDQAPPAPETVDLWSARVTPDPTSVELGYDLFPIVMPLPGSGVRMYLTAPLRATARLPFFSATSSLNDQHVFDGAGLISATGPYLELPPRSELQVVNGNTSSVVMEPTGESLLLLATSEAPHFELWSLGTSLAQALSTALTASQIDGLLSVDFQESKAMDEKPSAAVLLGSAVDVTPRGFSTTAAPAQWTGPDAPLGGYFREIFFQIPFLIADHLNSQQSFADAQRWYHYLFNPTASEPGVAETKRPWRYREFREHDIQSLRDALTNADALAAYRADPFNPHAIARLRPGAYQKSIFMKYIDNLLDWGDSLFSQFTMESVGEATMLYVMAADLLGPRPVELGPCGESSATPKTYADIAPLLRPADPNEPETQDFLIEELETFTLDPGTAYTGNEYVVKPSPGTVYAWQPLVMGNPAGVPGPDGAGPPAGPANPAGWNTPGAQTWKDQAGTPLAGISSGRPIGGAAEPVLGGQDAAFVLTGDPLEPPAPLIPDTIASILDGRLGAPKGLERDDYLHNITYGLGDAPPPQQAPPSSVPPQPKPFELLHARLVFCIPENKELRGYWDRVEDRLNKIRNCMDIAGVRRQLELFAPEIDPRMLVRMKAAGLTLDDVMNVTSGNLPPYRFTYLIDKAKQHAALVQGFGAQLLSALQQRDGEELTRLRTVHEQNLLQLRSQIMQGEIDAAEDTLESLNRQQAAAEYRRDYYAALSNDGGLNAWERTQQISTHLAGGSLEAASIIQLLSVGLKLLPNLGAPTAMKFGGDQIGGSAFYAAGVLKMIAEAAELAGKSAGIEATFQRRDQEWRHQVELAKRDLDQIAKQITAAEIRRDIAVQSQAVHERSIEQTQEVFDFLRDRFTSFGLYTWMSAELQKLHRMAFNAALSMARLAEQACQFEHPDGPVRPSLTGDYWDAGNAGLLAGDRLMLDLHNLERSYIETNYRTLEIEQSFSLARFDPDKLSKLKTDCVCDFEIPEWYFDLTYPNHYRRRIKAVRLTIPSVVGPHTNVGATLRLTDSHIRAEANLESPVPVPLRHTTAIAASMAQSDAGVFEFNFRDERYMPFEGAGVNSSWQLSLPKVVKPFDYSTISDVILRISYTAQEDETGALETAQEAGTGVLSMLTEQGVTRILSLRNDFPEAWNALVQGALPATVDIGEVHVPFFMSAFDLKQVSFDLLIEKLEDQHPSYPVVTFGGPTTGPGLDTKTGLYLLGQSASLGFTGEHVLNITNWGTVSTGGPPLGPARLDDTKVKDILLRVVLKRKAPVGAG